MNIEIYNNWYVRTDGRLGPWTVTSSQQPTTEQITNATKVYTALIGYGWSISAVCGIIGNMMHESTLSPAYIQETNRYRLPNSAANLSDVPNSVMQNFYMQYYNDPVKAYGIGLCQWDGLGITRQKLVGYCENNGFIWYDGDAQMARLLDEYTRNIQWTSYTYFGTSWTWNNYVTNTRTPEESAKIFRRCYEGASGGDTEAGYNARWFYDYFSGSPTPPTPPTPTQDWINGDTFANLALAYNGQYMPYSQYDCIGFVNKVWRDIPIVSQNNYNLPNGTNTLWRMNTSQYPNLTRTYSTTSPDNQNPTPVLWFKDTISNILATYGEIPTGSLLFHQISDQGPPAIPSQYAGDGIGNFVHVGIYCGNNQVMQSGGRDSGSVPGGGVHLSTYDSNAWNYAAFVCYVDCLSGSTPTPPTPIPVVIPNWMKLLLMKRKKDGYGRRYF